MGGGSIFDVPLGRSSVCVGLGLGLKTRDMLTSRLNAGFFAGKLLIRSRSFCSCAREMERERDLERARAFEELRVDKVGETTCDREGTRDKVGGSGETSVAFDSVSEKGELGKTLERRRSHSSGSCDLNLNIDQVSIVRELK